MVSTKRRATKQDDIPESIFDALNLNAPGQDPGKSERKTATTQAPSVEDLMKQLGALQTRVDSAERANVALTTAALKVVPEVKMPVLNMDGLPDPMDKPQEYAAEVAKRTVAYQNAVSDAQGKQREAQQAAQVDYDELWKDFTAVNPDYVSDMDALEYAVGKVKKVLNRKGVDVDKYMTLNSDRFFRDITDAYDKRFGKPGEDEDEPLEVDDAPPPRKRKAKSQVTDDDDDGRTGGIFGGIDGSSAGRRAQGPPPGDLIKDLQDIQRKTGYF